MTRSLAYQWGRCPCGGEYEQRLVEVRMTVEGKPVRLSDVFQASCPTCGSRVYKAAQLARIEGMMKSERLDRTPIALGTDIGGQRRRFLQEPTRPLPPE
jgi:hypothetical protein